jgi:hypothetical protein
MRMVQLPRIMGIAIALLILAVALCLLAFAISVDSVGILLFGWAYYVADAAPKVKLDWASIAVGAIALFLLGVGVHLAGRAFQNWRIREYRAVQPWRFRWTIGAIMVLVLLFSSGLAVIGMAHQLAWLLSSDKPVAGKRFVPWHSQERDLSLIAWLLSQYSPLESSPLPAGGSFSPEGEMLHSWVTYAMFSVGESDIPKLDRPWGDPKYEKYFKSVFHWFINKSLRDAPLRDKQGFGLTHYAANSWVMGANKSMAIRDITDGAANTLLIGEINANFKPWAQPVNYRDPSIGLNKSPNGFGGAPGSGGVIFLMADGSIRFVNDRIDPAVLRALSTPAGGEKIDLEKCTERLIKPDIWKPDG